MKILVLGVNMYFGIFSCCEKSSLIKAYRLYAVHISIWYGLYQEHVCTFGWIIDKQIGTFRGYTSFSERAVLVVALKYNSTYWHNSNLKWAAIF